MNDTANALRPPGNIHHLALEKSPGTENNCAFLHLFLALGE